jgi:putative ABC transport system ATP-binding protein
MATAEVVNFSQPTVLAPPQQCMIATEDLWKTYDMGSEQQVHALRGVNLRIQRSEYVAIMGPSGSGKSTLMNLIGCLDSPSKGNYWLNNQLVSELDDDELARIRNKEIGFVFQTFNLLARATALHNVELPLIYACSAEEICARRGSARRSRHKSAVARRTSFGGQRQRVRLPRPHKPRSSSRRTHHNSTPRPAMKSWRYSIACRRKAIPSCWSLTNTISPSMPTASSSSKTA